MRPAPAAMPRGRWVGLLLVACTAAALCQPALAQVNPPVPVPAQAPALQADFGADNPPPALRQMAHWVATTRDNGAMPFVVIDKVAAVVFVFDAQARLLGATPALLGSAVGDASAPGIGDMPLAQIRPQDRTTPAGRFVAALDRNLHGAEILWVDYDTAISLHAVVPGTAKERRAERLASATPLDNRVSFGCINVPPGFFQQVVVKAFTGTAGVVYILPETRPVAAFIGSLPVAGAAPGNRPDQLPR